MAVLGTCIYYGGDFRTIFFLLSVSACLKKKIANLQILGFRTVIKRCVIVKDVVWGSYSYHQSDPIGL